MAETCLIEGKPDPCTIVIVGASGDLTVRKLIPALYNLYLNQGLPDPFLIIGCSRTKMSDQDFRNKMKDSLMADGNLSISKWEEFAAALYYRSIDYKELPSFVALADSLRELGKKHGTGGNRIFYLATPPTL